MMMSPAEVINMRDELASWFESTFGTSFGSSYGYADALIADGWVTDKPIAYDLEPC